MKGEGMNTDFFKHAYDYLVTRLENSVDYCINNSSNKRVISSLLNDLNKYEKDSNRRVCLDGSGRSKESTKYLKEGIEGYYRMRVKNVDSPSFRRVKEEDLFVSNSGSGSGKTLENALYAQKKGLENYFFTSNKGLKSEFKKTIIINNHEGKREEYAPLGTEFEQASALILSCIGHSFDKVDSWSTFKQSTRSMIKSLRNNLNNLLTQESCLEDFTRFVGDYLRFDNDSILYMIGEGLSGTVAGVSSTRYGHCYKPSVKDLHVLSESHWRSRREGDGALLISGSGETDQVLNYADQVMRKGMRLYLITSFPDSSLSKYKWFKRHEGTLVVEGREVAESKFNKPFSDVKSRFLPKFEVNTYVTLDALLATIADGHDITESDMRKTHRDKMLE